jgi:hypothetical protein
MQASWWQYRQWRFNTDMSGDGLVTASDVPLWAEWIFYLPGDAFIAQFGDGRLGRFLELAPTSFGTPTSAALSVAGWLLALLALFYLPRFFIDIFDPTSRQQRIEERRAKRERKRRERLARRKPQRLQFAFRRAAPLPIEERREPRF